MIVPSIDLMNGSAVQLVGGRPSDKALDAGDPGPLAKRFGIAGEVAVIDLNAALGDGSNAAAIRDLLHLARCRVGGGIRHVDTALDWLDAGAEKVILGTAATPEVLQHLPPERTIAALDADRGEVVIHGWRTKTGRRLEDTIGELRGLVGGFLITFVEREGRLGGIDLDAVRRLKKLCGDASLTIAGGVASVDEIAALDALGVDAQVGMAIYTGRIHLADAVAAPLLVRNPDDLWPTVVVDESGIALGLTWSNRESVRTAIDRGMGVYHSRRRGLWVKGETSGATQDLLRIDLDCDRDVLRFTVRQHGGGFCHRGSRTCWGEDWGLARLARRIAAMSKSAPEGSYTRRLLDSPELLREKLLEEAAELAEARTPDEAVWEAADVIYFTLVALARANAPLKAVARELDRRERTVRRRSETEPTSPKEERHAAED